VAHIDAARDLAARIPGAKFVEFDGDTHSLITLEPDRVLAAIEEFITGAPAHLRSNRVLASIMVLDMVESTKHAAAMGDEAWKDLLFRHRATTDGLVAYYGGLVVDHAGDGVLATFDGPARSIRCAMDSVDKAHELGLQLRGGIHTGEVEREGQAAAGIAVHMAARISAFAEADEVLVSSTVRDLVAGSGIEFEDRGSVGEQRIDPSLGADPVAMLVYDSAGNFAAQFMKRDRASSEAGALRQASANNSAAVNGYDAYFGKYTVDEASRSVTQVLEGSLSPGDVGKVVTREMRVDGDTLTIELATTSGDGEPVTRTLVWRRSA